MRSRRRLEYPNSLSYQARTLIMLPSTMAVDGRSTIDECGLPLKSLDTSSSSVASRMPFIDPAAASRKASLICCTDAGFASSAVRSTTDTLIVGTRIAMPSSLPFRCGSTRPTAVAAPVVVGIMLTAPARARRRSLCGKSWMCWSLVYECTVDAKPRVIPKVSSRTFTVVARQLVVHDALETMRCLAGSYVFSLTPSTIVASGFLAGALMMTFLAPAWMCFDALTVSLNSPAIAGYYDRRKVYGHLRDTSSRQHADAPGPGRAQGAGALSHGRAGGHDIVDHHHLAACHRRRRRERGGDVGTPLGGREIA